MRIIAVANEKGGVAKTTTAVSLGGALVEMEQEVLLVDLDPQASMTLAMGVQPHTVRRSIADVLINAISPVGVSRETSIPGLDLLPSNSELELAERYLPIRKNHTHLLRQAIEQMDHYDTLVLDCPPSLGVITQNALVAADVLVMPTLAEYLSIYALRNIMRVIRSVRAKDNPKLKYRILITMLDQRISSHITLSKQLRAKFDNAILDTIIQVDTRLRDSAIAGIPITHFVSNTRSAMQYRQLAQELMQYVVSETVEQTA
jgi:chromosome partitioning protein